MSTRPPFGFPLFAVLGCTLATALPAQAQQQERASGRLEEVVVTATRRGETDLQTTAIAVSVVDSQDIDRLVARDIGEIAGTIPNFSAATITAFNAASFAIRGVGQTDIIVYQDTPVGVTFDDFVLPSTQTQLLDTFDIQSVEVLRGPQGTLFGKNTTGGAVTVVSKRPDLEQFGIEARLGAGSFGAVDGNLGIDIPLVQNTLALRFVGSYTQSDGYYDNGASFGPTVAAIPAFTGLSGTGNGSEIGGKDVFYGRAKLLWQPRDDLSLLLQYENLRDRSDAVPAFNDTPAEPGCIPFGDPAMGGCNFVWNSLGLTRDAGDPLDRMATTGRDGLLLELDDGQRIDVDGVYLNLDWDLSDTLTLYSVTGYREQEERLPNTYTGEVGPVSLFDANRQTNRETFQQEVRIASDFGSGFNFVAGAFYQTNDAEFCVSQILGFLDMLGLGQGLFGQDDFFNTNPQVLCNAQDATAYAVFGDFTFDVTDRFQIGVGGRWTQEEKDWIGRPQKFVQLLGSSLANPMFDPNFTWQDLGEAINAADFNRFPDDVVRDSEQWDEPTYRATLSYQFTDDVFGYFNYARGFKSGGYNDQTGTTGLPITPLLAAPYQPEFADSFEFGLKTDLFDGRLRFNAAAFYVEYKDAQRALVATLVGAGGATFQETRFFNAADVTVQGVELEWTALLTDNLTFRGNAAYNNGEYDTFQADVDFDGVTDVDLSGRPLTRTPEFAAGLQLDYLQELAGAGSIEYAAQMNYEDENVFYYSDVGPQFNAVLDERTLWNAAITYTSQSGRYFARVYGKNLSDERYRIASQAVANLWTHSQFGAPRNYGVQFGINFGL